MILRFQLQNVLRPSVFSLRLLRAGEPRRHQGTWVCAFVLFPHCVYVPRLPVFNTPGNRYTTPLWGGIPRGTDTLWWGGLDHHYLRHSAPLAAIPGAVGFRSRRVEVGGGERSISPASRCLQRSWIRSFVSSCSQVIQSRLALLGRGDWACRSRSPLCARYQLLRFYLLPPSARPGPSTLFHFSLERMEKIPPSFTLPLRPPILRSCCSALLFLPILASWLAIIICELLYWLFPGGVKESRRGWGRSEVCQLGRLWSVCRHSAEFCCSLVFVSHLDTILISFSAFSSCWRVRARMDLC